MKRRPPSTLDPKKIKTPAFVIEERLLEHNLSILKSVADQTGATVLHALKAWATWPLFPIIKKYLDGTEVSSLNEARLGREEFGPEVHMYAPAYKPEEFAEVLKNSSHIILNSFGQLRLFKRALADSRKKISVGLRINPEIKTDEKYDVWNPCALDSRLGIRLYEFERELKRDPNALNGVEGLHFHVFFERELKNLKSALPMIEKHFGKYFKQMKWVNFGGGQRITDNGYDVEGLIKLVKDFQIKYDVQVHLEPGAAIVWHAGTLVASVLDIIERKDVPYKVAILDISFEAHLADFILSPDLELKIRGAGKKGEYKHAYKFGGGTCLAGDRIDRLYTFKKPLKVGDKVVFEDAIQYSLVKSTMFNGVQHPSIVLWKDGKPKTLRTFTYQDFKNRMG
ncbi:MAG: carboxynorspermidine decarboxylase [Candidatus Taylorbacteria bacterium RIFCSPHIGHO2_01_FULL_51_15]|uniref:Carboxynorspermidine decarboxylase n=1 Tax=Candidatus Taylorbacteria bacterium RIFCSPHIGHO2_01_FULL_51_15 TaxID=1802304 RepID=A0A1G2MD90_9BACT|nr:MAG: carboxynorspermidine decarboxylase [Candidatus Taylorbacteria bacterium RIFCSPHIGHO2_01_FULL_51_15]